MTQTIPTDFNYDYFDNPNAQGYQGYTRQATNDQIVDSWESIVQFCVNHQITSALDIGCAKGFLVEALLQGGISAIGYDISDYVLSFAKTLPCRKHDIRLGISDSADAIFALGVLLYLKESELVSVLGSIYEMTGKLFLFSSYYEGDIQNVSDPLRLITRPYLWWRKKIEFVGFKFCGQEDYFDVYCK
ncbi:methyltransferase [Beggiatoa sp. PS]|nr:methyltransferase [Beggiatoa sp. PS]